MDKNEVMQQLVAQNKLYQELFMNIERAILDFRMGQLKIQQDYMAQVELEQQAPKQPEPQLTTTLTQGEEYNQPTTVVEEQPVRKKHGGRVKGSKNKKTLLREAEAQHLQEIQAGIKASAIEDGGTLFDKFADINLHNIENAEGNSVITDDRTREEIFSSLKTPSKMSTLAGLFTKVKIGK